jgi:hydrogenase maturation protease
LKEHIMARILILGYGNPLRSDDGLGWQVAVELFRANHSPEVEILPCHQLTPELAPAVSRVETVIFIDSAQGGKPGQMCCEEVRSDFGVTTFTHHLTPAALLAMSSELFGACPRAYLLSIQGESYEPGDSFSASVANRVDDLRARLHELIQENLRPASLAS